MGLAANEFANEPKMRSIKLMGLLWKGSKGLDGTSVKVVGILPIWIALG